MIDLSGIPLWAYPLLASVVVIGFAAGLALAFIEGAMLAGENPLDRWRRWRFFWKYTLTRLRSFMDRPVDPIWAGCALVCGVCVFCIAALLVVAP